MSVASPSPDPAPPAPAPTPGDVLRWCAAAAPGVWFPSAHAAATGVPRDSLDEPVWTLRQTGLIQVGDWVRGRGQGFVLTPAGEKALADPDRVPTDPPPPPPPVAADVPPAVPPDPAAVAAADARPTTFDRGEEAREALLGPRPVLLTPLLVFANAGWFLVGLAVAWRTHHGWDYLRGRAAGVAERIGAVNGFDLMAGDWWRLLTASFVHHGAVHLFCNVLGLAVLGPLAEGLWGRRRFLAIYLLSGVGGMAAAVAGGPAVVAGASGALCGLTTASVVWLLRYRSHLPPDVVADRLRGLGGVLLLTALLSFVPWVSWEGHLGGAVAGAAAAVLLDLFRPEAGRRRWLALAGLGLLTAAAPGVVWAGFRYNPDWEVARVIGAVRSALPGQVRTEVRLPGPDRVTAVYDEAVLALVVGNTERTARTRTQVELLKADAVAARSAVPATEAGEWRAVYLNQVGRFADRLLARLAAPERPTAGEWKGLKDALAAVRAAWDVARK